jgi:hypothetical protein
MSKEKSSSKYDAYKQPMLLASRGKPYGDLIPDGKLNVFPMTVTEEQIIATGTGDMGRTINQVVQRLTELPEGLSFDDLLVIDRFMLLLGIRKNTYGSSYQLRFNCPACGKLGDLEIDLDTMSVTYADDDWNEPFPCVLPIQQKRLELQMLRVSHDTHLAKLPKSKNPQDFGHRDQRYFYRIAHCIRTIDGEEMSLNDKVMFVKTLHGADSSAIDNAIRDHELGPDDILYTCSSCNRESEVTFPLEAEFFRPRSSSR